MLRIHKCVGTHSFDIRYKGNRSRDTAWYSILDSEWPGVRRALTSWLAADNFDAEGRQRRRLEDFFGAADSNAP